MLDLLEVSAAQLAHIQRLLQQRLPNTAAIAFGSRVINWPFGRGSKTYSDLDIVLLGLVQTDLPALAHLRADLEESPLAWRVDISDANDLPHGLRVLVEQRGVLLQGTLVLQAPTESDFVH